MDFYISMKNGQYDIDYSINNHTQFLVKRTGSEVNGYTIIPVNFSNHLPDGMLSKVSLSTSNCKNEYYFENQCHTVIAYFKFKESEHEEVLSFCSKRPFCAEFIGSDSEMNTFIRFWRMLNFFKSFEDFKEVVYTDNIFEYSTPELLSKKIAGVSKVLMSYKESMDKNLKTAMVNWIRKALLRFGISSKEISQNDMKEFPEAVEALNSLGFQVFKA